MDKRVDKKFYVKNLEKILNDTAVSGLDEIGVELLDRNTCERTCYVANKVRLDDARKELIITVTLNELQ